MYYHKKLFHLLVLFCSVLIYAQSNRKDTLRGEFTYLLKAKFDTRTDHRVQEFFSLQVGDNRAFFASTILLKGDSVMANSGTRKENSDGSITVGWRKGVVIPKTNFNFTIIQSNEHIQYSDFAGMSLLTYDEPIIKNWRLVDEEKIISTINCRKAEVTFKAWYSPDIPFPFGPMKFCGLPGLIIKITDDKGDFDFELVKSVSDSQLKGKLINLKKSRYTEAIETTQLKLKQAQRNARANAVSEIASYGTTIVKGEEILRQKEKEREKAEAEAESKKYVNPLELEN